MSTNYTEHLGLTLWEANDPVLRTEFNANHAKLDEALTALTAAHGVACGSYTGGTRTDRLVIDVGFRPTLAIILCSPPSSGNISDTICMLAIQDAMARITRDSTNTVTIGNIFTDTGLNIAEPSNYKHGLNYPGCVYRYALFH